MTTFIGVSFGVRDNKLCCIAASNGFAVCSRAGLNSKTALGFLYALGRKRDKATAVMFDSAVDIELIVKDFTPYQKDKLFGILRKKEESIKDTPLYEKPGPRDIVEALGYRVSGLAGKVLRIGKQKNGITLFDIESFFACGSVSETAMRFLGEAIPGLERNDLALWETAVEDQLLARCKLEADTIKRLAERVDETVRPLDLNLKQWYGPSAIASRCLYKWKARGQAKRLHEGNSPSELLKAIDCALIGGRVEQVKLGTVPDVVTVDLNSAYAYAVTLLSQFYGDARNKPLKFTRDYANRYDEPFSVWLVDYDLPDTAVLGVLPTRAASGAISFRRRGRGYFWQPEVDYLRQRYADNFRVKWGYVCPYNQVKFAPEVEALYDYRLRLVRANDPGQSIVKGALVSLYGKFGQNTGSAHFQCRAWAGWITSLVRRLLLEAATGLEDKVICFAQDAVHFAGVSPCGVDIGDGLGQWKIKHYARGLYIAPGIYTLAEHGDEGLSKQAARGANGAMDYERLARELSDRQCTELTRSFFVGWLMARNAPLYKSKYLAEVEERLDIIPSRLRARNYPSTFDWLTEYRDSTINKHFSGTLSARYHPQPDSKNALRLRIKDRGWV